MKYTAFNIAHAEDLVARSMNIRARTDIPDQLKYELLGEIRGPLTKEINLANVQLTNVKQQLAVLKEAKHWGEETPHCLERAESSKCHILREAIQKGRACFSKKNSESMTLWSCKILSAAQIFVIQHDWAAAFDGAKDFHDGEYKFPASQNAFEFQMSGHRVVVLISAPDDEPAEWAWFVQVSNGWWVSASEREPFDFAKPLTEKDVALRQIRAVCIGLEAEITTIEVVRAPHRLNRAREKAGALPIRDYHIVSLSRRSHTVPLDCSSTERRGPRLHFRRGHWRHFVEHKTWIRWTLVGNPALGSIDKEYRL